MIRWTPVESGCEAGLTESEFCDFVEVVLAEAVNETTVWSALAHRGSEVGGEFIGG